jgi:hypothetical protein
MISAAVSVIRSEGSDLAEDRHTALLLLDYMSKVTPHTMTRVVAVPHADRPYIQTNDPEVDDGAPATMVSFMSPIYDAGFAPVRTTGNLVWGLDERLARQVKRNKLLNAPATAIREAVRKSAARSVAGFECDPLDFEQILSEQQGAARIARAQAEAEQGPSDPKVGAFLKAESYAEPKDPRVINAVGQAEKFLGLSLIKQLIAHFKDKPNYAFQKPRDLADRMVIAASDAIANLSTDCVRMDGSISEYIRQDVDNVILSIAFAKAIDDVIRYIQTTTDQDIKVKDCLGILRRKVKSHAATLTGEPGTSFWHTERLDALIDATCDLLGFTEDEKKTVKRVGGGDDLTIFFTQGCPVTPEVFLEKFSMVCKQYGLTLTAEIVEHGQPVEFLARYWMPWGGDPNSCANVARWMKKLHTTPRVPLTPLEKLHEKCISIMATDSNTPILGEFARHALKFAKLPDADKIGIAQSWYAKFDPEDQFPNEKMDWYEEAIAEGMKEFDRELFNKAICDDTNPLEFPVCKECEEIPNTTGRELAVGIDGDVVPSTVVKPPIDNTPEEKPKQRKNAKAGNDKTLPAGNAKLGGSAKKRPGTNRKKNNTSRNGPGGGSDGNAPTTNKSAGNVSKANPAKGSGDAPASQASA